MESAIYNAIISTNKILEKQAIISNNLANISNDGFKEIFNYTLNTNNKENSYNTIKEYYNFLPGTLKHTERNLDVFVKDSGWLTVRDENGHEAYTKNGHLKVNSKGRLTIQNHEIVGNNCNIKIPNGAILKILSNGIIKTVEKKDKDFIEKTIGGLKLVILPEKNLVQRENGLFYINNNNSTEKYKNVIPHNKFIRLQSGILEASNVNISKNLIEMISNARQFEMQIKIISMCDQNNEYANQLININS